MEAALSSTKGRAGDVTDTVADDHVIAVTVNDAFPALRTTMLVSYGAFKQRAPPSTDLVTTSNNGWMPRVLMVTGDRGVHNV
jgi:hypothetical protein